MDDLTNLIPFLFTVVLGDDSFNSVTLVRMETKRSFGFEVSEINCDVIPSGRIGCSGYLNASTMTSALSILDKHYYPQT